MEEEKYLQILLSLFYDICFQLVISMNGVLVFQTIPSTVILGYF